MELRESIQLTQAAKPIFAKSFYAKLFAQHPELQKHFQGTTIEHQAVILTMQLSVLEAFYVNHAHAAESYLQLLGTKHSDRGIPEDAYPCFRDVLLETLEEFHGEKWSEDLEKQWHNALDRAVEKMLDGYRERFRV